MRQALQHRRLRQIDALASGHERDWLAVDAGKAIFAVIAVERQREGREALVIQMHHQRNFLLPGGLFRTELGGRQRRQGGAQIIDIKFCAVICSCTSRVLVVFVPVRRAGERIGFTLQRDVDRGHCIKVRCEQCLVAQRVIGNVRQRVKFRPRDLIDDLRIANAGIGGLNYLFKDTSTVENLTIEDMRVSLSTRASTLAIGGLAGRVKENFTAKNVTVKKLITKFSFLNTTYVGSIIGYVGGPVTLDNCHVAFLDETALSVTTNISENMTSYIGDLIDYANGPVTLTNCSVAGMTVDASGAGIASVGGYLGGVAAGVKPAISDCSNETGKSEVGGSVQEGLQTIL